MAFTLLLWLVLELSFLISDNSFYEQPQGAFAPTVVNRTCPVDAKKRRLLCPDANQ